MSGIFTLAGDAVHYKHMRRVQKDASHVQYRGSARRRWDIVCDAPIVDAAKRGAGRRWFQQTSGPYRWRWLSRRWVRLG